MDIDLTAEQSDFVRRAVETGRIHDSAQALMEAMALWVDRERRRVELLDSLDIVEASLDEGEGSPITQTSMRALADDVKRRGREHIAARDDPRP